jgi:hypothetical protein
MGFVSQERRFTGMNRLLNVLFSLLAIGSLASCTAAMNPRDDPPTRTPTPAATPSDGSPPPASLEIDGVTQTAGVGTYCWSGQTASGETVNACADMIGIPTDPDPLISSSPVTARLSLPLAESPSQLSLSAFQVSSAHELPDTARGYRWWTYAEGFTSQLPLETSQEINLELEPGLYVFYVFAVWEGKGDVSYGFLVEVK